MLFRLNYNFIFFIIFILSASCSDNSEDDFTVIMSDVIEGEFSDYLNNGELNYVFFLQNAECKCSETTLELIDKLDSEPNNKVIVVVNNKNHFSLPLLSGKDVKFVGVNKLISYGFIQEKDVLVEYDKKVLSYKFL